MTWQRIGWVADTLGVSAPMVRRLDACGILGPAKTTTSHPAWNAQVVTELAQLPTIDETCIPPTLVVRMGEPHPSDDAWRAYTGWTPTGPTSQRRNAVRGDWKIYLPNAAEWALAATVGPFVVGAWQITGYDPNSPGEGRHRYQIADDPKLSAIFEHHRWNLDRGWTVARRGPSM